MTIASEITRIKTDITDAYTACSNKGANLPSVENSDNLANAIQSLNGNKGLWIALASNKIFTSPNGIIWREYPNTLGVDTAVYGRGINKGENDYIGGAFLAIKAADTTNTIYATEDGQLWYNQTLADSYRWAQLCYDSEYQCFYLVARGTDRCTFCRYNWKYTMKMPQSGNWAGIESQVIGNNSYVVAVDESNGRCNTGICYFQQNHPQITWTKTTLPLTFRVRRLRALNGRWFIIGQSDNYLYSSDGTTWTTGTFPTLDNGETPAWFDIAYGAGKYIAINRSTQQSLAISEDGINWTKTKLSNNGKMYRNIVYADNKFIISGESTSSFYYSKDGYTWNSGTFPSSASIVSMVYGEI